MVVKATKDEQIHTIDQTFLPDQVFLDDSENLAGLYFKNKSGETEVVGEKFTNGQGKLLSVEDLGQFEGDTRFLGFRTSMDCLSEKYIKSVQFILASKSNSLCSKLQPLNDTFDPIKEVEHCADHQYMYANEELADRREQMRIENYRPSRDRRISPAMMTFYSFVGIVAVIICALGSIIYLLI